MVDICLIRIRVFRTIITHIPGTISVRIVLILIGYVLAIVLIIRDIIPIHIRITGIPDAIPVRVLLIRIFRIQTVVTGIPDVVPIPILLIGIRYVGAIVFPIQQSVKISINIGIVMIGIKHVRYGISIGINRRPGTYLQFISAGCPFTAIDNNVICPGRKGLEHAFSGS